MVNQAKVTCEPGGQDKTWPHGSRCMLEFRSAALQQARKGRCGSETGQQTQPPAKGWISVVSPSPNRGSLPFQSQGEERARGERNLRKRSFSCA